MSNKRLINKYVPPFVEYLNLPWYEGDGLMWYIDSLRCQEFLDDTDEHFKKAEIVNFNIIYHKCIDDLLLKDLKTYQSVHKKDLLGYNQKQKKNLFLLPLVTNVKISLLKRKLLTNILRAYNVFFRFILKRL